MNRDKIIAYLKNDSTEFERNEVEKWIRENPAEYNRLKYVWEKSGVNTEEEPDMDKAWMRINPEYRDKKDVDKKKIKLLFTGFRRIAAIFIIVVSIGFLFYYRYTKINRTETSFIITENNSDHVSKVRLDDGSVIWLNTASKIHYPKKFTKNIREVYLEGEAFFEVEHNKRKPFIVHTGNSITNVLGTSFDVKQTTSDNVLVTVVTGCVALSDRENNKTTVILKKGESGIFSEQDHSVKKQINENMNFLAWKTGKLCFNKTPLAEVCDILTHHYKINVKIGDDSLKHLNLTANYDNKSLSEVLEIMQLTLNIQYQNPDSCILFYPKP